MSKRTAQTELTDRNWQEEGEPEEAGVFTKASDNIIKERVIKTAKRRVGNNGDKPNLFAGFAGFGGGNANPTLAVQPTISLPKIADTNGDTKPLFPFDTEPAKTKTAETENENTKQSENNEAFLRKLKKLNQSVLKFAGDHVSKNPFVILSAVFQDYEKHLKRLQSEKSAPSASSSTATESASTPEFDLKPTKSSEEKPSTAEASPSLVEAEKPASAESKKPGTFSFGAASSTTTASFSFGSSTTISPFGTVSTASSFGTPTSTTSITSGFSFKPTTSAADSTQSSGGSFGGFGAQPSTGGFSFKPATDSGSSSLFGKPMGAASFTGFGNLVGKPAAADSSSDKKQDEEEDTPPQPEKVEHVEKEALYHIKCKLFLKAADGWNEKGIGIANLKKCNDKVQLLIRNDTPMGTIILNTLLHDKLPINKSGKNGLLIVATNEASKTETYLCRVNKDKVEEFYEKLEEYKKGAPAEDS